MPEALANNGSVECFAAAVAETLLQDIVQAQRADQGCLLTIFTLVLMNDAPPPPSINNNPSSPSEGGGEQALAPCANDTTIFSLRIDLRQRFVAALADLVAGEGGAVLQDLYSQLVRAVVELTDVASEQTSDLLYQHVLAYIISCSFAWLAVE